MEQSCDKNICLAYQIALPLAKVLILLTCSYLACQMLRYSTCCFNIAITMPTASFRDYPVL